MSQFLAATIFPMPDRAQAERALREHKDLLRGHLDRAVDVYAALAHLGVYVNGNELWAVSRWSSPAAYQRFIEDDVPTIMPAIEAAGLGRPTMKVLEGVLLP